MYWGRTNTLQNFKVKRNPRNCGLAEEMEMYTNDYTFSVKAKHDEYRDLCNEYVLTNVDLGISQTWSILTMECILLAVAECGGEIKVIREA